MLTSRALDWAVGGAVLGIYAIVQLWLLQGPHPFDPAKYFQTAVQFPDVEADRWTMRIGLIAPLRVVVRLFGPSEVALYAVPLLAGLALAAAVYVTTLVLFSSRIAAAGAALATALNVNYLLNSSFLFPDNIAVATFAAGFACLVLAARQGEDGWSRWTPMITSACAGFFFGWTFLIREFSPILAPTVVATIVLLRFPLRHAAVVAGTAVLTASLDVLYGLIQYGDPLIHAEVLRRRQGGEVALGRREWMDQLRGMLDGPLETVVVFPRLLLTWGVGWIALALLAVFTVALVWLRDRRLVILGIWLYGFWALMAAFGHWWLGSGELVVNVTNIRYWYPILPPLAIGAFGGLTLLIRRYASGRAALLTAVVSAAVAIGAVVPGTIEFAGCSDREVWRSDARSRWHDLRAWLATDEADKYDLLWTDRTTARLVPAYTGNAFRRRLWRGQVEVLRPRGGPSPPLLSRSLILLHENRFSGAVALDDLRRTWSPVFIGGDGRMVLLAHDSVSQGGLGIADESWTAGLQRERSWVGVESCGVSPYEPGG